MKITDEALTAAVKLSARYISDRFLPDKAIDLVDEAASRVRMENLTAPDEMKTIEAKLSTLAAHLLNSFIGCFSISTHSLCHLSFSVRIV